LRAIFIKGKGKYLAVMHMDAYVGTIAFADLTLGRVNVRPYPDEMKRKYLGGRGLGTRMVADAITPETDPLGPNNVLVLASGPLTGSGVPLGSRYEVSTKSPLNDMLISANSGGVFGWKIKKAGFDALVVTGKANTPVYVYLNEGTVEIRDARPYWGTTTGETTEALKNDLEDKDARVTCIGPAGERLSRIACIINESSRAAGRGGCGAVMGSKNLKAVVATGKVPIRVANEERFNVVKDRIRKKIEENGICQGLHNYGTAILINIINENFILPVRNFQKSHAKEADKVSGEEMARTILKRPKGCYACIVQCGRVCEVDGQPGEGPEYGSDWALGPDCGVFNLKSVAKAGFLCNEMGLDTISAGATIACAMEMSERGYLQEKIRFGDENAVLNLLKKMGYREGIGNELADGSYRFALHHGHPELSMAVKKQELPAYDPRGLQGHGLAYATSVRGGDHVYAYLISPEVLGAPQKLDPYTSEGKAGWVKTFQDLSAAIDASGMCLFTSFALGADDYADLIAAATGMPIDARELLQIGERIWNVQKIFNLKVGYTKKDDTLPDRLLTEPLKEGAPRGRVWQREPLLDEYYHLRGWSEEGHPTPQKLAELGL